MAQINLFNYSLTLTPLMPSWLFFNRHLSNDFEIYIENSPKFFYLLATSLGVQIYEKLPTYQPLAS